MQQTNSLIRKNLVSGKSAQSNKRFLMTPPLGGAGSGEAPSWVSAPCSHSSRTNPLQQGLGSCCFFLKTFFFSSPPNRCLHLTPRPVLRGQRTRLAASPQARRAGRCVCEGGVSQTHRVPLKKPPKTETHNRPLSPLSDAAPPHLLLPEGLVLRVDHPDSPFDGQQPPELVVSHHGRRPRRRSPSLPPSLPRRPPPQPALIAALCPPPRRAPTSPPGAGLPAWPRPSRAQSHAHWPLVPPRGPEASVPGAGLASWPRPPRHAHWLLALRPVPGAGCPRRERSLWANFPVVISS